MDTLPCSVSVLKVSAFYTAPREFYQFKTHHQLPSHLPNKPNSSISNKTTSHTLYLNTLNSAQSFTSQTSSLKSSPTFHQNPASGYAAALVHIAQTNNFLETIQKDVQRLSKLLRNEQIHTVLINPLVGEKERGQVILEVAKKGKFNKLLVRLIKMLVERNKVMMVSEVLVEFQRVCDQLSGTEVVLVSSKKKMEKDVLFGIAQSVQKISGALNVKIRNLVDDRLPSFTV